MIELSSNISEYIKTIFGEEFHNNYEKFVESKYPTKIRLADNLENHETILRSLKNQGIELRKIQHIQNAYEVISGENIIGKTVEHLLGKYYVQSLSSMIPPLVLKPTKDDVVLDLCAAPGSKSTQLSQMMEYAGTLYANEPSLNRVKALVHNLDKMNSVNMSVIKEKGELLSKKFSHYFDKILVDAPCSALGVVQKKQEVSNWWSTNSVEKISSLQLRLLISAIKMAKVGAEIVYSTCTLTVEENEYIIDKVLKKYPVQLQKFDLEIPHKNGFVKVHNFNFDESLNLTKRIIPWEINSEGFFVAKLKKIDSTENQNIKFNLTKHKKIIVSANNKKIKSYLDEVSSHFGIEKSILNNYKYLINDKDINFISADFKEFDPHYFIRIGTKFGIIDKNNSLKLHSHAAQIIGKYATKNIFEIITKNDLSAYLSGGIIYTNSKEKGQKIITNNGMILGTAITIKNQLKSQFPRSKRTGAIFIK